MPGHGGVLAEHGLLRLSEGHSNVRGIVRGWFAKHILLVLEPHEEADRAGLDLVCPVDKDLYPAESLLVAQLPKADVKEIPWTSCPARE